MFSQRVKYAGYSLTSSTKTLGLHKVPRALHREAPKVKAEMSKQHLAFLARHRFFCIRYDNQRSTVPLQLGSCFERDSSIRLTFIM